MRMRNEEKSVTEDSSAVAKMAEKQRTLFKEKET
jgi:hypothetical protein